MPEQARDCLPPEYEQLHVGVALYDPETGTVVDTNDRLESVYGYTTDQLREMSVESYSAKTDTFSRTRLIEQLRRAASGDPQQFRWRIKRGDGSLIWVQVALSELSVDDDVRVLAEIRDITEYITTSQRVGLLSRIMRHNLRNDLNVITGWAEHLGSLTDDDSIQRHAEKIRSTATHVGQMADSVKQIERAATPTPHRRTLNNATAAVRSVVQDVRTQYPVATIGLVEQTTMWCRIDEAFTHALTHAIENAIVHADRSDPSVTVTVGQSPNTGRVEIRIEDEAPRIPDVEIDALDESRETTSTSHGTGVGLFVMKWCIESLGGEITFARSATDGNVVSFYLPPVDPPGT